MPVSALQFYTQWKIHSIVGLGLFQLLMICYGPYSSQKFLFFSEYKD